MRSKVGRKIRFILERLKLKLNKAGFKLSNDYLSITKLFTRHPLNWEHFVEQDWPLAQIELAKVKLFHLKTEIALLDRYLNNMIDKYKLINMINNNNKNIII